MITQMRAENLFPDVDAPTLSQYGGQISLGTEVAINHTEGNLYYTTDGSDPRLPDGTVNPTAIDVGGALFPNTLVAKGDSWKYDDSKVQPSLNVLSIDMLLLPVYFEQHFCLKTS